MKKLKTIVAFIFLFNFVVAHTGMQFVKNKQQWPGHVLYMTEFANVQLFVEQGTFTYRIWDEADLNMCHDNHFKNTDSSFGKTASEIIKSHVFKVSWLDADFSNYKNFNPSTEYYNYFIGQKSQWSSDVKAYGQLLFSNIYNQVDLKLYSKRNLFKYDVIVHPGADLSKVKLQFNYTNGLEIKGGKLYIKTSAGILQEQIPEAYQIINGKKIKLICSYILSQNNIISFSISDVADVTKDIIIDPVVVISSYSGTQSYSFGLGAVPGDKGNIYTYGLNLTKGYPVTAGAVQTTYGGGWHDGVLSKFNASGSVKFFSTYIGGNKHEYIINCQVLKDEVTLFGTTASDTFPVIQNGYMTKSGGYTDYFILKIDTSGKNIVAGTFLGGTRNEGAASALVNLPMFNNAYNYAPLLGKMIMDKNGEVYITGSTTSFNYPVVAGAIKFYPDSTNYGEMVVSKLSKNLKQLLWSTYLGTEFGDAGAAIAIGNSGYLYCVGNTTGNDFITTPFAAFPTKIKPLDMVVVKIDSQTGQLAASTYLGSKGQDGALDIALDINENVYITSICNAASSVSVTPGAYNSTTGNNIFYKLSSNLDQLLTVARFGSDPNRFVLEIDAFNVDSCGNVYFGGFGAVGLPTTSDAIKSVATEGDVYVGVFNPNFSSLKYATYYGGTDVDHDDGGFSCFDKRGTFYHGVCTNKKFPVTPGAYSTFSVTDSLLSIGATETKYSDAFVKMDIQTFVNASSSLGGEIRSCTSPITATFIASANQGTVSISPGDGTPPVYTNSLVHTYNNHGIYTAYIVARGDSSTCNHGDSIKTVIKYGPPPSDALADSTYNCFGVTDALDAGNLGALYSWNTGQATQIISPYISGMYYVNIDNGFCNLTDSSYLKMLDAKYPMILPNIITPNGDGVNEAWDFSKYSVVDLDFTVYNRWGTPVYTTTEASVKWNGVNKHGQDLSDGTYFWIIKYRSNCKSREIIQEKGFIHIAR